MEAARRFPVFLVFMCWCRMSYIDTTSSDASLILSTQPKVPAVTSIRTSPFPSSTELSAVSSEPSTAFTSTVSVRQVIIQCWPHKTSQCPEKWYQVGNETCLLVIRTPNKSAPELECQEYSSRPVNRSNIIYLRSCLTKILGDSTGASSNFVVRLNRTYYVNVQNETEATGKETYSVICIKRTLKFPRVSMFSLHIYNTTTTEWDLVDISTGYVTVNTRFAFLRLTCEAVGSPQPQVTITDAWHMRIKSGSGFTVVACSGTDVFTCTANNSLGSSQAHRRIHVLTQVTKMEFTLNRKHCMRKVGSGDTVELRCSVEGCPDTITITRSAHPIAETADRIHLVYMIKGANCSHMGNYTCVAKSRSGQDEQKTASLEVRGCPVSLCEGEDASREMSPILGDNVTFSLCLMSSERFNLSANETRIVLKLTRNHINHVYWTASISMHNIQVSDYRTLTVRIANSYGSLDVHFTLTDEDRSNSTFELKPQGNEFEFNVLLIAVPPICFICMVFITAGVVWYRVKSTCTARSRAVEKVASDTGCEDTKRGHYENTSPNMLPNAEYGEAAGMQYESIILNTYDIGDLSHTESVETDDVQHETPVNSIDINKLTSRVHSSEAEYANNTTYL